jgi:hypothetical protein
MFDQAIYTRERVSKSRPAMSRASNRLVRKAVEESEKKVRRAVVEMLDKNPRNLQALRVAMLRDQLTQLRFGTPMDIPMLVRAITGFSLIVPVGSPEQTSEVLVTR